jgi:hypothetical protein
MIERKYGICNGKKTVAAPLKWSLWLKLAGINFLELNKGPRGAFRPNCIFFEYWKIEFTRRPLKTDVQIKISVQECSKTHLRAFENPKFFRVLYPRGGRGRPPPAPTPHAFGVNGVALLTTNPPFSNSGYVTVHNSTSVDM